MNQKETIIRCLRKKPASFVSVLMKETGINDRTEMIRWLNQMIDSGTVIKELKEGKAAYSLALDLSVSPSSTDQLQNQFIKDINKVTFAQNLFFENENYSVIIPDGFSVGPHELHGFEAVRVMQDCEYYKEGLEIVPGHRQSVFQPQPDKIMQLLDNEIVLDSLKTVLMQEDPDPYDEEPEILQIGNTQALTSPKAIVSDRLPIYICSENEVQMFQFRFIGLNLTRKQQKNLIVKMMKHYCDKKIRTSNDIFLPQKYTSVPKDDSLISQLVKDMENAKTVLTIKDNVRTSLTDVKTRRYLEYHPALSQTKAEQYRAKQFVREKQKILAKALAFITELINFYSSTDWTCSPEQVKNGWKAICDFLESRKHLFLILENDHVIQAFSTEMETLITETVYPHLFEPSDEVINITLEQLENEKTAETKRYRKALTAYERKLAKMEAQKEPSLKAYQNKCLEKFQTELEIIKAEFHDKKAPFYSEISQIQDQIEKTRREISSLGIFSFKKKEQLRIKLDSFQRQEAKIRSELSPLDSAYREEAEKLKKKMNDQIEKYAQSLEKKKSQLRKPVSHTEEIEIQIQHFRKNQNPKRILTAMNQNGQAMTQKQIEEALGWDETDETVNLNELLEILQKNGFVKASRKAKQERAYSLKFNPMVRETITSRDLYTIIPDYLFFKGGQATLAELDYDLRPLVTPTDRGYSLIEILNDKPLTNYVAIRFNADGKLACVLKDEYCLHKDLQ